MIKIEQSHESTSYWKQDGLYDKKTKDTRKFKLFGLTLWSSSYDFDCDLVKEKDIEGGTKVGFQSTK